MFVVEAGIINIVNIYITFTIMITPTSTSKKKEKEKGGLPNLNPNFKIINIINIFIKLNFNGRIGDADGILDVRTNSLRSSS